MKSTRSMSNRKIFPPGRMAVFQPIPLGFVDWICSCISGKSAYMLVSGVGHCRIGILLEERLAKK